jgi:hypothetical protein
MVAAFVRRYERLQLRDEAAAEAGDVRAELEQCDLALSWDIDPGMLRRNGRLVSEDPLVLPSAGQRPDGPAVTTAIPNLLLAGDYLKGEAEVANVHLPLTQLRTLLDQTAKVLGSLHP